MGKIIVSEFISLDGVIEAPGGGEDYEYAGWTFDISRGKEGDVFKLEETLSSEALLLGRLTYEGFAKAWPTMQGEFADKFNGMPKYVITHTLDKADWNNTTLLKGEVIEEVSRLKKTITGNIVTHGSSQLVQALIEHDLVDELRLMVFPVILGKGKRLFGNSKGKKRLHLFDSKAVGDGVEILTYTFTRP